MLLGWYAYAAAAEPFVVSAMATYLPLFLESISRDNAVWAGDRRTPCNQAPVDSPGLVPIPIEAPKCVVRLAWAWVDTSSLPLYTFSFSVAVQTLLVVSISGLVDQPRGRRHRKLALVGFAILGSLATCVIAQLGHVHYYSVALLAVVANSSFGAVTVCGNSYLPQLVKAESDRLRRVSLTTRDRWHGAVSTVCSVDTAKIAADISGKGVAGGYVSALLVQVLTMLVLVRSEKMLQPVIGFVGLWWLLGQIPVVALLKEPFQGPPSDEPWKWNAGWRALSITMIKARELQDVMTFLVGWFLLSDAVTTINSTAVLFARANLQMETPALAFVGLLTVVFAITGSLYAPQLRLDIVTIAIAASLIPLYGVVGFFVPWIGLKRAWEMYLLASWYGLVLGSLNAVCRSQFSLLIPSGQETMFFALYAVTDKGSSVLGPAITGVITDKTHDIRYTFYFLLGMMLLAAYFFSNVDFLRGHKEAEDEALPDA